MSWLRTIALVAGVAALSASSLGQETAPAAPAPAPATSAPPPPAPGAAQTASPVDDKEFVPSQELSADEQVTFPVDI